MVVSTYQAPGEVMEFTADAAYTAGDPVVLFGGQRIGLVVRDVASGALGQAHLGGRHNIAKAASDGGWSAGDRLYYNTATKVAQKAVPAAGYFIGLAAEDAATADTDADILLNADRMERIAARNDEIWIDDNIGDDTYGDGTEASPVKTLAAGWALLSATRNTVILRRGTFPVSATLALPAYSINVIGAGKFQTIIGSGDDQTCHLFARAAGALAGTTTYHFQDHDLNHGKNFDGVRIDNTSAGKKLFVDYDDVECEGEGGAGRPFNLHTHGDIGNAVKFVATGGGLRAEFEGEIYFAVGNSSDLIDISHVRLTGGFITTNVATAMKTILQGCIIPAAHATGGASQQVVNVWACVTESGNNLTEAIAADIGGSQTVRVLAFDAP